MTIFCDLDGVLRTHFEEWKAFKYFMGYGQYMEKAAPIRSNIDFILELGKENEVMIASCCRYELLNDIWLELNGLNFPVVMTSKEKVKSLAAQFDLRGSCLIDDNPYHIKEAFKHGMKGIYVPKNSNCLRHLWPSNF